MKSFNKVIVLGNLTRDPEIKYLPSGMPVASLSVAINDNYKRDGETIENVSYFDVVVFSKQGENCNEYLRKGSPVMIEGRLQQRRWDAKDGTKRSKVEIVGQNIVFLGGGEGLDKKPPQKDNYDPVSDDDIPF